MIWLSVTSTLLAAATIEHKPESVYSEDKPNIVVTSAKPTFTLKLKANPTTGYSWFLREYDSLLVMPIKQEFIAGDTDRVGAPGYELWTFKVKPAGFTVPQQTVIRLIYARPWQANDSGKHAVFSISTLLHAN